MSDALTPCEQAGVHLPGTGHPQTNCTTCCVEPLSAQRGVTEETPITYGMCLACRSIEVALVRVVGTRDLSDIGESATYPVGYGCEVCA